MSATSPLSAADTENPLVEGLERLPVHPTSLVIFGATGDLAHRKLLPALYNLAHEGQLPERFEVDRRRPPRRTSDEDFRDTRRGLDRALLPPRARTPNVLEGLLNDVRYVQGSFDDDAVYAELARQLDEFDEHGRAAAGPRLLPVDGAGVLPGHRRQARRRRAQPRRARPRCGSSSRSRSATTSRRRARSTRQLLEVFEEQQIFRIDHYLGKETVQNLMALRFANALFEPVWNRNYIDHVQITAAEDIGIGGRAGYYEHAGALRDLVQNHMLQLLALLTMEPPTAFDADRLRDEKLKVLRGDRAARASTRSTAMAVRAQYGPGVVGGVEVPGYREEDGVAPRLAHRRPTRRCACTSPTGAGPACRSTCAPASGWRAS